MSRRNRVAFGIAGAVAAIFLAGLGVLIGRAMFNVSTSGPDVVRASTPTAVASATSSIVPGLPSATESPSAPTPLVETPTPAATVISVDPAAAPTAAPTSRPSTNGPAISVRAIRPPVGTEVTDASVTISVDVDYEAGPVSNVLGWTMYYCYGPNDCNTYSLPTAYDVLPGTAGSATLEGRFISGSAGLRHATICRLSVVIGHFVTPEVQWDSQTADRPACHPQYATIRVLDVQPALNAVLEVGATVSVNLQYDASPITSLPASPPQTPLKIRVSYYADNCATEAAVAYQDLALGATGTNTIKLAVFPASAEKKLWHISARIVSGDTTLAAYGFGPC